MKHFLLTSLITLSVASIACGDSVAASPQVISMTDKVVSKVVTSKKSEGTVTLAPGVTQVTKGSFKKLYLSEAATGKLSTDIKVKKMKKAESTLPDGYVFYESFEDWDGTTEEWLPTDWSLEMKGEVTRTKSWNVIAYDDEFPEPADGDYYVAINYSSKAQDEWLITPQVEVQDGMTLGYYAYINPVFLFDLDYVDWDTYEFTDKVVAATLQIWVQADGEDWVMLHDYFDDYTDMTLKELLYAQPSTLEKKSVSLSDYVGKKVKIAFRYVGKGGDTILIDAVGVGYPSLDDTSYLAPFSTLYWGMDRSYELNGLGTAIAMYPVYEPLTWTNMSSEEGATYQWKYSDPETGETVTDDDQYELTVTYAPNYTSDATKKNNWYCPPELTATAEKATPGSYVDSYDYFQAGGTAEYTISDDEEFTASLIPFNPYAMGLMYCTIYDEKSGGDDAIPIFGHDSNTDTYWLNYSLNKEEKIDGDYSKLIGIGNLFVPSNAPLVVNGITVHGYGKIDADAELTASIYALNEEMSADYTTFTKIASDTIKGSDILTEDASNKGILALPFDFDTPAVVVATDEHPAYVFMLEGFNSDKVEYFAPIQSQTADPYLALGYTLFHIDLTNHVSGEPYYSFKPMIYKDGDEYVEPGTSFAIGIEGEYPWLTTETEKISIASTGEKTEVALGSYYDGSKLTVEVPAGAEATIEGRYDECVLTVWHDETKTEVSGNVVVTGSGVELTIPIEQTGGVADIEADGKTIEGIYNLSGIRVSNAENGFYIIRYTDGSVAKKVVKK